MKNIKTKISIAVILVPLLFIFFIVGMELYTWKSHGYDFDYRQKQKCIEVSPLTAQEKENCEKY